MQLTGKLIIGQKNLNGLGEKIYAINPTTNELLEPVYFSATLKEVDEACNLAYKAFDAYRNISLNDRAIFLEKIALNIEEIKHLLIPRAMLESGLTQARLEGECARTCNQLRLFANTLREGSYLGIRVDEALPNRSPLPRPDLRYQKIALGPVVVFGASNFPLAFSVAGGDTASALAAGCPVIVKAHNAHPGTSEYVGKAIQKAVDECGLPAGVFSLIYDDNTKIGSALIQHPHIKAVGFTGSRAGGLALVKIAENRPEPIPVYAEMSSINPVVILNSILKESSETLAISFINSLTQSAGQFCTNPGLIVAIQSSGLDLFKSKSAELVKSNVSQTMLSPNIYNTFQENIKLLSEQPDVTLLARGIIDQKQNQCQTHVFTVNAKSFLQNSILQTEVFGSCSLIVECEDLTELNQVLESLEGQLTSTIHMNEKDLTIAQNLLPILERKAGRILVNGWPTGVEVCEAMVHGGPFPSTSDSRTTSVGTSSIDRFLRPVCYQNFPIELLPNEFKK